GCVFVVVVIVSVTQLPFAWNVPLAQAPQYGLCGPTMSPLCVVVWVVCVVCVDCAPTGPETRLATNIAPAPTAIAKDFRIISSLLINIASENATPQYSRS